MITVSELMRELGKLPGDYWVVAEGFKEGYDEVTGIKALRLKRDEKREWFEGKYIDVKERGKGAVCIFREEVSPPSY